jgi:hypothetical protein
MVSIQLSGDGQPLVDGTTVPVPTGVDPHQAALAAVARHAAALGRPVRARATDPDGTCWPLIIHPDGTPVAVGEPRAPSPPRLGRRGWRRRHRPTHISALQRR